MAEPAGTGGGNESWEYSLRKYLLLLATLVATVTYGAGFNPPGGVWQTADPGDDDRMAGDPIIRNTDYARYLVFFYSNATAFASSLVVIVLILILSVLHDSGGIDITRAPLLLGVLRAVMVLDLLSLMGAYAAGAFRDTLTAVYSLVLSAGVVGYLVVHLVLASWSSSAAAEGTYKGGKSAPERLRKVLMLLATFAANVTYLAGLSAPGGFWDHAEDGHSPGDAILKGGPHDSRLKAFFVFNTTAFVASLLILVMLLEKKLCFSQKVRSYEIYGFIAVTLISLLAAYAAGSSREIDTTIYVSALVGVVAVCILIQVVFVLLFQQANLSPVGLVRLALPYLLSRNTTTPSTGSLLPPAEQPNGNVSNEQQQQQPQSPHTFGLEATNGNGSNEQQQQQQPQSPQIVGFEATNGNGSHEQQRQQQPESPQTTCCSIGLEATNGNGSDEHENQQNQMLEKARSLVLLLATLATAITYQAGLNPPGGLWQNGGGSGDGLYKTGDPILLTMDPRRYKTFYYCNSVAFVASLVAIVLVRQRTLHHHNALEAAMVLDLFGLIGAYAAGSCRHVSTSIYVMALAGGVLVYVVIHVTFFTMDHKDGISLGEEKLVEKRRKRLLLFAILAATITYQAGLTPPGGFLGQDDSRTGRRAGDPVLLNNYPRRYTAFFYSNSASFMLSIALIILLVNPNLYRPAIRSNALSVCTATGLIGIMGGYAAGCTQHLKTSIYIFALAAVVLSTVALLVAVFLVIHVRNRAAAAARDASVDEEASANSNRAPLPAASTEARDAYVDEEANANSDRAPLPAAATEARDASVDEEANANSNRAAAAEAGDGSIDEEASANSNRASVAEAGDASVDEEASANSDRAPPAAVAAEARDASVDEEASANINRTAAAAAEARDASIDEEANANSNRAAAAEAGDGSVDEEASANSNRASVAEAGDASVDEEASANSDRAPPAAAAAEARDASVDEEASANINRTAAAEAEARDASIDEEASASAAGVPNAMGAEQRAQGTDGGPGEEAPDAHREEKRAHGMRKYLMLLGILVASVTYQAGLAPPGGSWQSNDDGTHTAGDPVMHDDRRARYLAFFYSNSASFVASVIVIVLLLPDSLDKKWSWWLRVMNATIVLDLLGLLIAYAAGSSRTWKTSVYVSALVLAVLAYFAIHVLLSRCVRRGKKKKTIPASPPQENGEEGNETAAVLQLTESR